MNITIRPVDGGFMVRMRRDLPAVFIGWPDPIYPLREGVATYVARMWDLVAR